MRSGSCKPEYNGSFHKKAWRTESGYLGFWFYYFHAFGSFEHSSEVNHGTTLFERIPQAQQPGLSKGSSILTAAGIICRGCPGTESEVRKIYHTDDLIGEGRIQEQLVGAWARIYGCWFEFPELYLSSLSEVKDYGTESVVYFDVDNFVVRKLIYRWLEWL